MKNSVNNFKFKWYNFVIIIFFWPKDGIKIHLYFVLFLEISYKSNCHTIDGILYYQRNPYILESPFRKVRSKDLDFL